jgi:hypothetical protein
MLPGTRDVSGRLRRLFYRARYVRPMGHFRTPPAKSEPHMLRGVPAVTADAQQGENETEQAA